jgi:hypothetical protein
MASAPAGPGEADFVPAPKTYWKQDAIIAQKGKTEEGRIPDDYAPMPCPFSRPQTPEAGPYRIRLRVYLMIDGYTGPDYREEDGGRNAGKKNATVTPKLR